MAQYPCKHPREHRVQYHLSPRACDDMSRALSKEGSDFLERAINGLPPAPVKPRDSDFLKLHHSNWDDPHLYACKTISISEDNSIAPDFRFQAKSKLLEMRDTGKAEWREMDEDQDSLELFDTRDHGVVYARCGLTTDSSGELATYFHTTDHWVEWDERDEGESLHRCNSGPVHVGATVVMLEPHQDGFGRPWTVVDRYDDDGDAIFLLRDRDGNIMRHRMGPGMGGALEGRLEGTLTHAEAQPGGMEVNYPWGSDGELRVQVRSWDSRDFEAFNFAESRLSAGGDPRWVSRAKIVHEEEERRRWQDFMDQQ